ncbi:MAG: polyprenyl diphosphate synthase [Halothiobacillaceae bacterium]|nr:polyprenyl diphosphate synthase [Halothiobacillaceae bacterium]
MNVSSTSVPTPRHVAIIMDGNGRWAKQHGLPRVIGHRRGANALRRVVRACVQRQISVLTVFAFSSENWQRPETEVKALMVLFVHSLRREVEKLHEAGVRLRFIGERSRFDAALQHRMDAAERLTVNNSCMTMVIAVNYGGRWDLTQAARALAADVLTGRLALEKVDEHALSSHLALADLPEPDLLIRSGGEQRISNFLLWQMAYTELYFTQTLWPDFRVDDLELALAWFAQRDRRFGRVESAQLRGECA